MWFIVGDLIIYLYGEKSIRRENEGLRFVGDYTKNYDI